MFKTRVQWVDYIYDMVLADVYCYISKGTNTAG